MSSLVINSYLNQLLFLFLAFTLGSGSRFLCRFSAVKLCDNIGIDPIQLFLGENTQERPCQIQRLEDRP